MLLSVHRKRAGTDLVDLNLGKTFKVDKQTTLVFPVYLYTPLPHTNVGGGRLWAFHWSLILICAVRG